MPNISTLSLRELNQLVSTLHGWDRHEDLDAWRLAVLSEVLPALGSRAGVFVTTWAPDPVAWWVRPQDGEPSGGSSDDIVGAGDFRTMTDRPWWELLSGLEPYGLRPPFGEFIHSGKQVEQRRWHELQGGVTFHEHPDGELSWLGFFEFDAPPLVFAEQTLPLLRILERAFQAGAEGCRRGTEHGRRLRRLVDAFPEPAILLNMERTETFRNRALDALVRNEPGADAVESAFHSLRDALSGSGPGRSDPLERTLELARGTYTLRAAFLDSDDGHAQDWVLIRIESAAPQLPSPRELRDRFGLTPRETEIALGLARGLSDKALAKELGISWHTVRRHVERTLPKLEVSARAKVMERILTREP